MAEKEKNNISAEKTEEDLQFERRRSELRKRKREELRRRQRQQLFFRTLLFLFVAAVIFGLIFFACKDRNTKDPVTESSSSGNIVTRPTSGEASSETKTSDSQMTEPPQTSEIPTTAETTTVPAETTTLAPVVTSSEDVVYQSGIRIPSWINIALITPNNMSRPQLAINPIQNIVIHWVGNAGSSAMDNRDYFDSLRIESVNPSGTQASSHFVVGLQGEIVEAVPLNEIAYAQGSKRSAYNRNTDCISIETCHPDWDGKFNDATYASVVKLAAWLCEQYHLTADCLIRHYDVSGKECPKYYVEHPDAWEQLKTDVASYMQQHPDIANEFP